MSAQLLHADVLQQEQERVIQERDAALSEFEARNQQLQYEQQQQEQLLQYAQQQQEQEQELLGDKFDPDRNTGQDYMALRKEIDLSPAINAAGYIKELDNANANRSAGPLSSAAGFSPTNARQGSMSPRNKVTKPAAS